MPKLKREQKLEIVEMYKAAEANGDLKTRKQKRLWFHEVTKQYGILTSGIGLLLDRYKIHTWRSQIKKVCPYRRSIAQVMGPLKKVVKKKQVIKNHPFSESWEKDNLVETVMSNGIGAAIKEFASAKLAFEKAKENLIKAIN